MLVRSLHLIKLKYRYSNFGMCEILDTFPFVKSQIKLLGPNWLVRICYSVQELPLGMVRKAKQKLQMTARTCRKVRLTQAWWYTCSVQCFLTETWSAWESHQKEIIWCPRRHMEGRCTLRDPTKHFRLGQCTSVSVWQHWNHNSEVHTAMGEVNRILRLASNVKKLNPFCGCVFFYCGLCWQNNRKLMLASFKVA